MLGPMSHNQGDIDSGYDDIRGKYTLVSLNNQKVVGNEKDVKQYMENRLSNMEQSHSTNRDSKQKAMDDKTMLLLSHESVSHT
jgi:hypothetical protein